MIFSLKISVRTETKLSNYPLTIISIWVILHTNILKAALKTAQVPNSGNGYKTLHTRDLIFRGLDTTHHQVLNAVENWFGYLNFFYKSILVVKHFISKGQGHQRCSAPGG